VWLTIDDGPSDDTLAMLDLLDRHGARATFFVVGDRAARRPELIREIVPARHTLGNHSQTHPQAWFWALGPRQLRQGDRAQPGHAGAITGTAPRWFRAVVGLANPFVAAPLREHGLARVAWCARGFDAIASDPQVVVARIERGCARARSCWRTRVARMAATWKPMTLLLQRLEALGYARAAGRPRTGGGDRLYAKPLVRGRFAPLARIGGGTQVGPEFAQQIWGFPGAAGKRYSSPRPASC
jgi:peptidoglycan/xylan/chitin deacetylase (PgdA/CDA1 family)